MGSPSQIDLDLDAITGPELRVKLGGEVQRFYAVFSSRDVAHYQRLVDRERRAALLYQRRLGVLTAHEQAQRDAAAAGTPPPLSPDLGGLGMDHPDFYSAEEQERDIFTLLRSVWQASEHAKPAGERRTITDETVRTLSLAQAQGLLFRLWRCWTDPRVPVPARPVQPASAAEAVTSTASSTATPAPRRQSRRKGSPR